MTSVAPTTATSRDTPPPESAPENTRWRRLQQPVMLGLAVVSLLVLVVLPVGMLILGSFSANAPGGEIVLTLGHYELIIETEFLDLLRSSLIIATGSTLVAIVLGGILAGIVVRTDLPYASTFEHLILIPAYITPFIGALAWTLLLSPRIGYVNDLISAFGLPRVSIYSWWGIIWVMGLYYAPIAYLYIRPSLQNLDRSFEEAGRITGATAWRTLRKVVFPLTLPAVLSTVLIVFVQAIGQFSVPAVLGSRAGIEVLPTKIVRMTTQFPTNPNGAAVLGIALTIITLVGLAVNNFALKKREFTTITSRGATPWRKKIGKWRYLTVGFAATYVLLAVIVPVAVMAIASLQPYLTTNLTDSGFTLRNYVHVLTFPNLSRSITNSVILAIGAAATTTVLAVMLGYIVARTRIPGKQTVDYLGMSPLAIPHTVFGLAMLWTWVSIPVGVYGSMWILYIAYVALFLPFSTQAAATAFRQIDRSLEEASRVSGASWGRTVRKVVAPLLGPALLSGAVIVLYHSVRELAASLLLYSPGSEVMSVAIWSLYGEGQFVELFALALINIVLVLGLVYAANFVSSRWTAGVPDPQPAE